MQRGATGQSREYRVATLEAPAASDQPRYSKATLLEATSSERARPRAVGCPASLVVPNVWICSRDE